MTSQLMLPTTAIAMSRLGQLLQHAPEKRIDVERDDQPVGALGVTGPQRPALARARLRDDGQGALLEAEQLGPYQEADDAGIVNGSRMAVDPCHGHQRGDEPSGLAPASTERRE